MNDPAPDSPASRNARASAVGAMIISAAVALSRVLGLVREMVFAALYGAGGVAAAFTVGFRIPNLLRDLFAEGALSTAFVTVFSKESEMRGQAAAWSLANKIRTLLVVVMGGITVIGILTAPWMVGWLAPTFEGDLREMTILLTRIMFPFIGMVSMAALVMGMLNACKAFTMPALASCFFNLGSILGGLLFAWLIDPAFGPLSIVGMALGTLIGGFLQLSIQLPTLARLGYRPVMDFHWRDQGVAYVLKLMGPAVIASSAVQVNVMVNTVFATYVSDYAVNWLNYAFRLMQLPLGMFGVAIATVTLPLISRSAARQDFAEFRETLARGVRFALFLTVPSAAGLIVLGRPIVSLLYERGAFTETDVGQTAAALAFYAVGLLGYACLKVVTPAFYAVDRRFIPMVVGMVSIAVNAGLNYYLIFRVGLGHVGLALSTSLLALLNFLILYLWMGRILRGLETRRLLVGLGKLAVAGGGVAGVAWMGTDWVITPLVSGNLWVRAAALLGVIGISGVAFLGSCLALRMEEVHLIVGLLKKKLRRG